MIRLTRLVCTAAIGLMGLMAAVRPWQARGQRVLEVGINGFTCSMCALGTEATLAKLPFVDSVQMDIAATTARLYVQPERADWQAVAQAITDAGFSVRSFYIIWPHTLSCAAGQPVDVLLWGNTVRLLRCPVATGAGACGRPTVGRCRVFAHQASQSPQERT